MSYEDALQATFGEKEDLKENIINLNEQIIKQQAEIEKQNSMDEINKIGSMKKAL